jgi:glycosyltransferase involved in cell wall biosynthesis
MPLIDVILPTYNQPEFLEDAINHILDQTFQDFEFYIVDDGSKQDTKDILKNYATNNKIHIIYHEKNKGLPSALNTGHRAGKSSYCTWVSTDNISFPRQLEVLYNHAVTYNLDFVQSLWRVLKNEKILHKDIRLCKDNWGYGNICPSFLYKRKIWETYNYDESMHGAEDLKFYLQALLHPFKFGHVEEELVEYRCQPNSITQTADGQLHVKNYLRIYEEVVKPIKEKQK